MDHSEQQHAQKNEPRLDGTPPATVGQPPAMQAGDMPTWLSNPPAAPTAGQRWGRRVMFLGLAIVTVAVAGGATLLGLSLYESNSSTQVVTRNAPAPVVTAPAAPLPFIEKRPAAVPPLVLLPADPNAKNGTAATAATAATGTAAAAPAPAPAPAPVAEPASSAQEAPVISASGPKVVTAPPPLVTPMAASPVKPVVAAKENKALAAVPKADKLPETKAAAPNAATQKVAVAKPKQPVKKAVVVARRPVAKAQSNVRPVKGTMLQAPRERSDNEERSSDVTPPRQAIDRRCQPGELARECAARIR